MCMEESCSRTVALLLTKGDVEQHHIEFSGDMLRFSGQLQLFSGLWRASGYELNVLYLEKLYTSQEPSAWTKCDLNRGKLQ